MKILALAAALSLALVACGQKTDAPAAAESASDQPAEVVAPAPAAAPVVAEVADPLDAILAGDWRSPENKARDQYRHPKETLAFFGVKPTDTVIEITPGGGWYTEILSPWLWSKGTYIAAIASPASSEYNKKAAERFRAKLVADPAHYESAKVVEFDPKAPNFGADGSADVVLTFRNVHNWVGAGTAEGMFKGFFAVLKAGGTLGVADHRAADDATPESLKDSGYLTTASVVKLATDAGFELAESSEINANPKDTRNHPEGVWTLPPSLALKDVDRDKYLAIGESDRMTLRFVKPKADAIFKQGTDAKPAEPTHQ